MQSAFLTVLHVLGFLFVLPFRRRLPFAFLCITGFFWGALLWVLAGVACILIGIPFNTAAIALSMATLLLVLVEVNGRYGNFHFTSHEWKWLVASMAVFVAIQVLLAHFNFTQASDDSFYLLRFSRVLCVDPSCNLAASGYAAFGVFLPLLHAAAYPCRFDYFYCIQPTIALLSLAAFFYCCVRALRAKSVSAPLSTLLAILVIVALFSADFIVFQSCYIHNSFASAAYLFLFCATAWFALEESESAWLPLSVFALTAFSLQRTENSLTAMAFAMVFLGVAPRSYKAALAFALPYLLFVALWYYRIASLMGAVSVTLDASKASLFAALHAVAAVFVFLLYYSWARRLLRILPWLMLAALLAVICAAVVGAPARASSLAILLQNLFWDGRWGVTWAAVLLLFYLAPTQPRLRGEGFLVCSILSFFFIAVFLALFQGNRLGWGDSVNRIVTHVLPIISFYLLLKYAGGIQTAVRKERTVINRPRFALAAFPALLVFALGGFLATKPIDYAIGAAIINCPPHKGDERFDFPVALRGMQDRLYAAAATSGPLTLVIDLGKQVNADVVEQTEYSQDEAFKDYAWHVSEDLMRWREIYDSRAIKATWERRIGAVTTQFPLGGKGSFRYVRLSFRSSKGQNRLLLRNVSVLRYRFGKE